VPDPNHSSDDARDRRISQLQHALDSRVVIEQAKGILAERFGLKVDDAFELMRHGARTTGTKLAALATEVIAGRQTPPAIADALVRAGYRPEGRFVQRAADAEESFANLNEALADLHANTNWTSFVCECANPLCMERIEVTAAILERIHENRGHYVVKPGHEVPDVEETVAVLDEFIIVRKRANPSPLPAAEGA
jgi:ANTAR domain